MPVATNWMKNRVVLIESLPATSKSFDPPKWIVSVFVPAPFFLLIGIDLYHGIVHLSEPTKKSTLQKMNMELGSFFNCRGPQ